MSAAASTRPTRAGDARKSGFKVLKSFTAGLRCRKRQTCWFVSVGRSYPCDPGLVSIPEEFFQIIFQKSELTE